MSCAVKISNCYNFSIENLSVCGFSVGCDIEGGDGIEVRNSNFLTKTGVRAKKTKGLKVDNCRHDDLYYHPLAGLFRLKPIVSFIRSNMFK